MTLANEARNVLFGTTRSRRSFRCPLVKREVETEFEEGRFLGFRGAATVKRCTAFEVPSAIECRRGCVNSAFRRQWEYPLPIEARAAGRQ